MLDSLLRLSSLGKLSFEVYKKWLSLIDLVFVSIILKNVVSDSSAKMFFTV